jgi:hypothetical protein
MSRPNALPQARELTDLLPEVSWRQGQITISKIETSKAHVCGESGQHQLDVRFILIPVRNTMDSEGVPQVSKTWLVGRTIGSFDSSQLTNAAEMSCRPLDRDMGTVLCHK